MNDEEIRLELVRLVIHHPAYQGYSVESLLEQANSLYAFIQGRWEQKPKANR